MNSSTNISGLSISSVSHLVENPNGAAICHSVSETEEFFTNVAHIHDSSVPSGLNLNSSK